jgi:head-tail adaptor
MRKGKLRDRVRFERPVAATGFAGAGSGTWDLVCEVWAEVQDALPSRGERLAEGINASQRPARVRLAYRPGLDTSMRILVGRNLKDAGGNVAWHTDRILQLVSGPAELGRRDGLEFMAEEYSPAGNAA